jgi:hypothetical protein
MFSIFAPLDPDERPAEPSTGFRGRNTWTGPFSPRLDDPLWKTLLSWLFLPALLGFLSIEIWLGLPAVAAWLLVIGFCVGYAVLAWIAYRNRHR